MARAIVAGLLCLWFVPLFIVDVAIHAWINVAWCVGGALLCGGISAYWWQRRNAP